MRRSGDVEEKEASRHAHDSAMQEVARDLAEKEGGLKEKGWHTHVDRLQAGRPSWKFCKRAETAKIAAALDKYFAALRRN